jgi:hypothetical protein
MSSRKGDTQGLLFLIYGLIVAVVFIMVVFMKMGQLADYDEIAAYAHTDEMRMIIEAVDSSRNYVHIGYSLGKLEEPSLKFDGEQGRYTLSLTYLKAGGNFVTELPLAFNMNTIANNNDNIGKVKRITGDSRIDRTIAVGEGVNCDSEVYNSDILSSETLTAINNLNNVENWNNNVWEEFDNKKIYFEIRNNNDRIANAVNTINIISNTQNKDKACNLFNQLQSRFSKTDIKMINLNHNEFSSIAMPDNAKDKEVLLIV